MEMFLRLVKCGHLLLLIVISFQQILKHKQYFVHCVMKAYGKGCELEEEQTPSSSFNKQSNPLLNSTIFLESIYEKCGVKSQKECRKRVLTLPAERNPMHPQLNINNQFNYIFYVGDKIVNEKKNIQYIVEDLLGQGTFGQILLCHSSTGFKMAVKVIKCQPAYINQGLMEVKFLRAIANMEKNITGTKENYLNVYDAFKWKGHICTAMEVMDNSLLDILKEAKYEGIQMKWIEIWTKKLLFSLAKIHRLGIMHCDIKPENVMFRPEQPENPLFIDFSSGCESSKQLFTYIQSRYYRAPEVLLGQKPYTDKIDIWSMGCLLAELYLGLPLFPGFSSYDQLHKILRINEIEILSVEALETAQFVKNYFNIVDVDGTKIFKLKDIEQFENETGQAVALNENYFYFTTFDDMLCYRDPTENEKPTHELFINLIKQMLKFDAEQRISAEKAFLHPFTGGLFSELDILNQIVSQEKQTQ